MRVLLCALCLVLAACDSVGLQEGAVGDLVVSHADDGYLIQTEADYPCANYRLAVDVDLDPDRVTVEIEGVEEADGCLRALGPAQVVVPAPPDQGANPTHELVLKKDGAVDRYLLLCGVAGCSFNPVGETTFSRYTPR